MTYVPEGFFINYQVTKLDISSPNLINIIIILIFLAIVVSTHKRGQNKTTTLLDRVQTEQLRGLAIFFIVLGHLWFHVAKTRGFLIFSGDAVFLFLVLSGYGLSLSNQNKKLNLKMFIEKRIKRVMIPYWVVTVLIFSLDFLILNKSYSVKATLMTLLGLNFISELGHFDYARWFITFLLFWYVLFFITNALFSGKKASYLLLAIAIIILPFHYYFLHIGWYQFLSFPVGCLLATYYDSLAKFFNKKTKTILLISFSGLLYAFFYKFLMSIQPLHTRVFDTIPNILLVYHDESVSLFISVAAICIIGILGQKGFISRLLLLLGKYSYEIFLLHGVFLIKYDPIIRDTRMLPLLGEFFLLILFLLFLSFCVSKISAISYGKKIP